MQEQPRSPSDQQPVNSGRPIPEHAALLAIKLSADKHNDASIDDHEVLASVLENILPGVSQGMHIEPLISSQEPSAVTALVERAARMDPTYKPVDFGAWYQVHLQPGMYKSHSSASAASDLASGQELNLVHPSHVAELARRVEEPDEVECAHAMRPVPPPMPVPNPEANPREANEIYHAAAPQGIDARYAWTRLGGDGAGIGLVDIERGWDLNHEDLRASNITLISGVNQDFLNHGTSVLGEILMTDNAIGGVGIAPNCTARVISQWRTSGQYNTPATIIDAVAHMSFGDVLQLEAQEVDDNIPNSPFFPVEIKDATYEAIRLATALGITVVEAGSNGSQDLDTYANPAGLKILNRSSPNFRDSGAIMVGAATSSVPHDPMWFTNHGSRIDLYAWGENVDTTTIESEGTYISNFSGTSSATPIISGSALCVQGIAQATMNRRFSPLELRRILAIDGTPSRNGTSDKIGIMPNLRAIIDGTFVQSAPDIYIRDFVGDAGSTTTRTSLESPDIIVWPTSVVNPQNSFGNGGEFFNATSHDVVVGKDNHVFVRLLNRGGSQGTNINVSLYYSQPASLQVQALSKLIGNTTVSVIPARRFLTVSDEILFAASAIPVALGPYTFIAIAGNPDEPAPAPVSTMTPKDFVKFVGNNNRVAMRSFNVVSAPPAGVFRAPIHVAEPITKTPKIATVALPGAS
ncbi:subtilisin-like protein [Glonium stellatum]|uniref:Subtilisin-like protein n=1 Tax=Glonium stellatum TaxID=574774 RepID=A0A8E2JQQ2_9PEZI|nr:subtilisin-like protein [Glonium stellatum]